MRSREGWGGSGRPGSARSTPRTSRSSSSACWEPSAMPRTSTRLSSAARSLRWSSTPACMATREIRCASTSCISRAIRLRSRARACAARAVCSRSALSARSRKDRTSTRRAPTAMPTATAMPAVSAGNASLEPQRAGRALDRVEPDGELRRGHVGQPDDTDLHRTATGGDRAQRQKRGAGGECRRGRGDRDRHGDGEREPPPPQKRRQAAESHQRITDDEPGARFGRPATAAPHRWRARAGCPLPRLPPAARSAATLRAVARRPCSPGHCRETVRPVSQTGADVPLDQSRITASTLGRRRFEPPG